MEVKNVRVLVTYQIPQEGLKPLASYEVDYPEKQAMSYDEVLDCIDQYDAVLAAGGRYDRALLQKGAAGKLRMLSNYGAGYDNVDVAAATEYGVVVTNIPDSVTESTAELAFGGLVTLARGIAKCDRLMRSDESFRWGMMNNLGINLYGKTLGIIGMGRIGRAVARRALAFGMDIVYYNRKQLTADLEIGRYVGLDELLRISDCVSLNCPLTPETTGLIDEAAFGKMKTGALLVNTARGAVCDEDALLKALRDGKLGGAALDVFVGEPEINREFLQLDNVVLTPHIGTEAREVRVEMTIEAAERIRVFLEGGKPDNVVNEEVYPRR